MAKIDAAKVWALNYRLLMNVLNEVAPAVAELGLEIKELFLLAELDAHPHPAELARALLWPKATVTVAVKRMEAAGFLRRELETADLRRHRLSLTTAGRKVLTRGLADLSEAFGRRLERLPRIRQLEFAALLVKMS